MRESSLNFLRTLVNTPSPTGHEVRGQRVWLDYVTPFADETFSDAYGNCVAVLNKGGSPRIMLAAHADEIAMAVNYIDADGYLYVRKMGGVDAAITKAQRVTIHTRTGPVKGVVGNVAPHLMKEEKDPKPPKMHDLFIDIGANVGTFTLVGAKRAPRGEVHAFEPSAYHFKRLADNIARNGFRNVQLNQLGLFDEATEATLYLPLARGEMSNTGAASMFKVEGVAAPLDQQETIRLMRLDDYVTARNLNRLDIIKIDIEGAELNALRGAVGTLRRFRPLVLMEVDLDNLSRAGSTPVEVLEFWHDLNYRVKRIDGSGSGTPIAAAEDLKPHQNIMCLSN